MEVDEETELVKILTNRFMKQYDCNETRHNELIKILSGKSLDEKGILRLFYKLEDIATKLTLYFSLVGSESKEYLETLNHIGLRESAVSIFGDASGFDKFVKDVEKRHSLEVTNYNKERGKQAVIARHENMYGEAKKWVQDEWRKNKGEYKNNKSSFARSYVSLAKNKYLTDENSNFKLTERTIRESWLKGI